ncbi:TIGR02099 family protein [Aliidiomarina taiwanensis]|uniref:TIGR02099 family protein n=1 Tax=Aliidiomarina taiwanensis TaxID=946228 RepID=A0A432X7J8_9GAMM|nr:YhdP family protein [Aliidiomarina taiwanensis]RUO42844.1 TIGR02099 family protein [Aliidiomarina taiwanensis]
MKAWRALAYCVNKLWLLLAILLVTAALLLSAVRLSLPYLDHYRTDIELFIQEHYGQEVTIGALNARWTHFGPALVLEEMALVTDESLPFELELGEVQVVLSFWQSLAARQLVFEEFELDDVVVDIYAQKRQTGNLPIIRALENLLLNQLEHFEVRNSTLNLHTADGRERTIHIEGLRWLNRSGMRQATGRFSVPDVTANHLNFIAEFDSKSEHALTGNLYVEASRLDISPWIAQLTSTADIVRAEFNLRGWIEFENARFIHGQVHFDKNHLEWQRGTDTHTLSTSATTWLLTPQEGGWLMNSEPLQVTIDGQAWPIAAVAWEYQDGQHLWNLDTLEIRNFGPVWSLFGSPGEEVRQWSSGLQPQGHIEAFKVRLSPQREWQFYVQANDLSWQHHRGIPGVSGLSFEFWSDAQRGRFEIKGEDVSLLFPSTFKQAQELSRLEWSGYWERDASGWSLRIPNARISLPQFDLIQDFRLAGGEGKTPTVEWAVGTSSRNMPALNALAYLPLQLGDKLNGYLRQAINEGVLDELSMVWRGSLVDFPYKAGEGVFQAKAALTNLNFSFRTDWLPLEADRAVVYYQNETLRINAAQASIGGVAARNVQVRLPELLSAERWMHVSAEVAGNAAAAQQVFAHSSLKDSVGAALEQVVAHGDISGQFQLSVPFFDGADTQLEASVSLMPQRIHFAAINTDLENVSGLLRIRNGGLSFQPETAEWHGIPLTLAVTGTPTEQGYQVAADVRGEWGMTAVADAFPAAPVLQHMSGEIATTATFEMNLHKETGFDYLWDMRTNLTGVESKLPEPFHKQPGEIWFWQTQLAGDNEGLRLTTGIENVVSLEGRLTLGEKGFHAAQVRVGPVPEKPLPEQGLALHVKSEQVDIAQWLTLFNRWEETVEALPAADTPSTSLLSYLPESSQFTADIATLNAWTQRFHTVDVDLTKQDSHWFGQLNADETRMTLDYAEHSDAIRVNADFLELSAFTSEQDDAANEEKPIVPERGLVESNWLARIPAIEMTCRICRYDGKDLGRVTFGLDGRFEGEQLRHLRLLKSGTRLDLKGGWTVQNERVASHIEGEFNTSNISALLLGWGTNSVVQDSAVNVKGSLGWSGSLVELNRETLNGNLTYTLGAGYLRDVNDGGARLLSVLSLESILRKLTLDFRDIFARGMFYSSFGGTLDIHQGTVSTSDTEMIGAAGDLTVAGTTDLVTEALDYQLSFTPKVTSSLPVLLAWMINPPSGLAALVIDRVLHEAKVISRLEYQVSGTVSAPVVTEVKRDAKNVELPEEELRKLEETLEQPEPDETQGLPETMDEEQEHGNG